MKRILAATVMMATITIGCQEDPVTTNRPDFRLEKKISEYKTQLIGSEFGWEGFLFPGIGGGFGFHLEFAEDGTVLMLSDINQASGSDPLRSTYQIKAFQRPSLVFDTYTYLHLLADPNPNVNGGVVAQGYYSDFEFSFVESTADTITLKGNKNGSDFILVKCTQERKQSYESGLLNTTISGIGEIADSGSFPYLQFNNGIKLSVTLNLNNKTLLMLYESDGVIQHQFQPFAYTASGIYLKEPIIYGNVVIREIFFNEALDRLFVIVGELPIYVKISPEPLYPLYPQLGLGFTVVALPYQENSPGWSSSFNDIWTNMAAGFYNNFGISTGPIYLVFDKDSQRMDFYLYVSYQNVWYLVHYPYSYTMALNGVLRFSQFGDPNANGTLFESLVRPILNRIEQDRLTIEYFETPTEYLGKVQSLDTPGFSFAGTLH